MNYVFSEQDIKYARKVYDEARVKEMPYAEVLADKYYKEGLISEMCASSLNSWIQVNYSCAEGRLPEKDSIPFYPEGYDRIKIGLPRINWDDPEIMYGKALLKQMGDW